MSLITYGYQVKCKFLINKCKKVGLNYCIDPIAFIEYLSDIESISDNTDQSNPSKIAKY